ncbi:stromelysin-2-like [Clytia hemisphaerica]
MIFCFCIFLICSLNTLSEGSQSGETTVGIDTLSYLHKLGYYYPEDGNLPDKQRMAEDDRIRNALIDFQKFAGLPVSGIIDRETKSLMRSPRCGVEDLASKRRKRFTLQGSKWWKKDLTWTVLNENNDGLTRHEVENVVKQAFDTWQKVTGLNFWKVDHRSEVVDISVEFHTSYHGDRYMFDGNGGKLAHAFYPNKKLGISGDIHLDDDEIWKVPGGKNEHVSRAKSLLWVLTHEIGHSLGLKHSKNRAAIMHPWYRGNKEVGLHHDDIIGVQSLYGPRNSSIILKRPTSPPPSCPNKFKAVLLHKETGNTYVINDGHVYVLGRRLGIDRGPFPVGEIFEGISHVDSLYYDNKGKIVLHYGKNYSIYEDLKGKRIESGTIQHKYGFSDDASKIDAALRWKRNKKIYFFIGKGYYRFDEAQEVLDAGYPRLIYGTWKGLPESIDSVVIWRNKITYFFKDHLYYRFNYVKKYPRKINPGWTQCTVGHLRTNENINASLIMSPSKWTIILLLLSILKFYQS